MDVAAETASFEFSNKVAFDPGGDFEALLAQVPAKWAVYLMSDEQQRPVQLLCVKNLRYSVKRRLGLPDAAEAGTGRSDAVRQEIEADAAVIEKPVEQAGEKVAGPRITKRVDYRAIVRQIAWVRVDSAFEADWIYLEAARRIFPHTYQGMTGLRPAWFVHINPEANFPRYTKTQDLSVSTGILLGPLEDKHAAARLIEDVTDWFDLCRYYNILVQAPAGKACAYKEMGKCPAPCDGSIGMDQYRWLIQWSTQTLIDPCPMLVDQKFRMAAAAAALKFETAQKIKAYVDSLSSLGKGAYRYLRRLEDFAYVALQRGARARAVNVFLIAGGAVVAAQPLAAEPDQAVAQGLIGRGLELAEAQRGRRPDRAGIERIGIVSHQLFAAKQNGGVYVPLEKADLKSLAKAYREVAKQPEPQEHPGEGVVKDLGLDVT
jgi:hypothetical protein